MTNIDTSIPDQFRRTATNGVTVAATAKPVVKADAKPTRKERRAAASTKQAKPVTSAKPEKAHKASNIVRTAENPIKSIVPAKFKAAYSQHDDTCGRPLNVALKLATTMKNEEGRDALDVAALKAVAKANGIDFAPYEKLNNGQKRMNVGNKLAGLVKAGTTVVIGGKKFADATKALRAPEPVQASA